MKYRLTLWQVKRWEIIGVDLRICYYVYWLCFIDREVTFYLCTIPGTVNLFVCELYQSNLEIATRARHFLRQVNLYLRHSMACTFVTSTYRFRYIIERFVFMYVHNMWLKFRLIDSLIHLQNGFHFLVRTLTNFDPIR